MDEMRRHSGCCGCRVHGVNRREFLASAGGLAAGIALFSSAADAREKTPAVPIEAGSGAVSKKPLLVQPVITYQIYERREAVSWRPWGGLHSANDVDNEIKRIERELRALAARAGFPVEFRPVGRVTSQEQAESFRRGDADVMLIYAASGGNLEALITPDRYNLIYVRHKSGPVYLWYEIAHPWLLRKAVDEYGQPGLEPYDVIVDKYDDLLWRLRALFALKNTLGTRMVAVGGPSGWGHGGRTAPKIASDVWKMDIQTVPYDELGKRIASAKQDASRIRRAQEETSAYLKISGTRLETDRGFVERAFLLKHIFDDLMMEAGANAITINDCMTTIIPMSETTACLALSLINDEGRLAFCESDFVVIPSGVLLHHIAGTPVFLQDPTYPHHGIVTLAHCTAPRKMDGKRLEKTRLLTHFESDYGAAPKVDMRIGQVVTVVDPDFANQRWIGFRGKILENPFLDICRTQVDVAIEGDCTRLAADMRGFHWMLVYGDYLKETGYALRKLGVGWYNLTADRTVEA